MITISARIFVMHLIINVNLIFQCVVPINEYPNIVAWLKRCEENLPKYAELNVPGMKLFHDVITSMITA